jgi:hypothetical protein
MAYRYEFKVGGKGSFPIDMLRYDACWPRDQADVHAMDSPKRDARTVTLASSREPTAGRWASFMWPVLNVSKYKV